MKVTCMLIYAVVGNWRLKYVITQNHAACVILTHHAASVRDLANIGRGLLQTGQEGATVVVGVDLGPWRLIRAAAY